MSLDQAQIEKEVNKVTEYPKWPFRQNYRWNCLTNFIYDTLVYEEMLRKAEKVAAEKKLDPDTVKKYATARWYCFWTSEVVLARFTRNPLVKNGPAKHFTIDILIAGRPFDVKITRIPLSWSKEQADKAIENPTQLLQWYYAEGSHSRFHRGPRLFIVTEVRDAAGERARDELWKMKREFAALAKSFEYYMEIPQNKKLAVVKCQYEQLLADIIFVIKEGDKYRCVFYSWGRAGDKPDKIEKVL